MSGTNSARAPTRTVWRTVLSSPFSIDWPSDAFTHPTEVSTWIDQNADLSPSDRRTRKKRSTAPTVGETMDLDEPIGTPGESVELQLEPKFVVGITAVLKYLEDRVSLATYEKNAPRREAVLFVCKADVSPISLVAPIPLACAAAHTVGYKVHLAVLPRGSEPVVARTLGLRRAAAVLFPLSTVPDSGWPGQVVYLPLLDGALAPPASATCDVRPRPKLPVRIKHVRSVAPLDLNRAREAKKAKRAERKRRSQAAVQVQGGSASTKQAKPTNWSKGAHPATQPQTPKPKPTSSSKPSTSSARPTASSKSSQSNPFAQSSGKSTASPKPKSNPFAQSPASKSVVTTSAKDSQGKVTKPQKKGLKGLL